MSTFDADTFMNSQFEGEMETKYHPIPVADDYVASITKVEPRMAGDKPVLEVTWATTDARAVEATGQDTPTVRQTIWLDLNASGALDMGRGKNVGLGRLRAAVNQNNPGQPWQAGMLIGQSAMIKITHRMYQNEPQSQVAAVSAL